MDYTQLTTYLEQFFTPDTMSVHCKPGQAILAKKGIPGGRSLVPLRISLSRLEIHSLITDIQSCASLYTLHDEQTTEPVFIEIERTHSQVIQLGPYRIVYTRPPVSSVAELTIVRPVKKLTLDAYALDHKIIDYITDPHHGVLIAGSPGEGKSTFAQALTDYLAQKNLVIKTIEAPRDLQVDSRITQLSFFHASHIEIRDILLLSRPDITIFDEVRNHDDFHLYKDLRLAGIGMIGVMHATEAIDALQRFLHAVDLGSASHVISCIVFIKSGAVQQILQLRQTVKVPLGMLAEDLARPVIEVIDMRTQQVTHEVYSYGEQIVVMPTDQLPDRPESAILQHAATGLAEQLTRAWRCPVKVQIDTPTQITVSIPKHMKGEIIGKNGATIQQREKKLGCSINIETSEQSAGNERYDATANNSPRNKKKKRR